ncbi:tRNA methyltransferase complex GCD14 subunit [Amanita rubescens]|nr:tRNA methyltransferase complex GCD14 subunit [Amanita rubescens]
MWSTAREISAGDTVIIWMTRDIIQPIVVTPGQDINNRFGYYRHSDLVGVPYGSKVASRNGKGFIHLLRPTPELWTMALPHRTQILYLADIAFITSYLDLKRGSKVIEAGTGSGSFSHSIARTIGPSGHLWTYEFHEARAKKAREEFSLHGMNDTVTLTHRNVCKDGFTVVDEADAVFLDLPAPWDAVDHAKKALRKDKTTRICCFSPCIEQVLRTVSALNDAGFITMYETLQRPLDISQITALPSVKEAAEKLKQSEEKREEKRLRQIAANKAKQTASAAGPDGTKRKRDDDYYDNTEGPPDLGTRIDGEDSSLGGAPGDDGAPISKKLKTEDISGEDETTMSDHDQVDNDAAFDSGFFASYLFNISKAFPEVRGHTSYLTFARLLPSLPAQRLWCAPAGSSLNVESGLADS